MRYFLYALVFSCLVGVGAYASESSPTASLVDLKGQPAPQIEKQKQLVVFWASWCPDCRQKLIDELPKLNERKDLAVLTVNVDKEAARARSFVEKNKITLPVLRDDKKILRTQLKVFSVPYWALFKREPKTENWELVESGAAFNQDQVAAALAR